MAKNNVSKVINFIAFVGLAIVAVVLVLQKIFSTNLDLLVAFRTIGEAIAYFITAISAYFYVRSKRNVWWYVAYTVAVVLVVIFMVIRV
ncbi:MAG: hypothetical protein IJW36_03225 [Clostridia bacterium]|nr:hypothetical protein [Clostridia bacterium]